MSKKFEALKKAVFYAATAPETLAEILESNVSDVATSITINGDGSIKIPASSNTTKNYTATVFSQFEDEMSGTSATLSLKTAVTGVSISSGTVTVASTCTATSFTLKAVSGTITAERTITLTK